MTYVAQFVKAYPDPESKKSSKVSRTFRRLNFIFSSSRNKGLFILFHISKYISLSMSSNLTSFSKLAFNVLNTDKHFYFLLFL